MDHSQPRSASEPSSIPPAERLYFEFLELRERGEAGDFELFCARHPELAPQLRELESAHAQLVAVASRIGQGAQRERGERELEHERSGPWERVVARLTTRSRDAERYEVKRPINRGGMGVIYEVYDRDLRRNLAMKVVRDSGVDARAYAAKLGRFLEEAQVTGQLEHPSIVPIHDLGVDALGRVYFTMKLVDGKHLRDVFELARASAEGWNLARVLQSLLRVCEAVAFAHSRGVIHRDLKPENIMVGRFGETYVMDWGLAKLREELVDAERAVRSDRHEAAQSSSSATLYTVEGQGVGTPCYMPPEQALGRLEQIDERSDVYALGAILYHLLAGRAPFARAGEAGTAAELIQRVVAGPPESLAVAAPAAASELVAICEKAMARERSARYASVLELSEDLRAFAEGRVVRAHRTGVVVELRKWVARNRALAAALALALVGGLATAGVEWRRTVEAAQSQADAARADTERSIERERLLREQSIAAELATADMAAERGAWDEVLAAVERARERGCADEVDLLCRQVDAWIAKSEHAAADEGLARLAQLAPSGAQNMRFQVLRAMRLATTTGRREECASVCREALAAGASGADRAFVEALLAPTTEGAIDQLRAALELRPYHSLANDLLMSLLIICGRYDEGLEQSRQFARMYPRDPRPQAGVAVCLLMLGEKERARVALTAAVAALGEEVAAPLEGVVEMLEDFGAAPPDSLLDGSIVFMVNGLMSRASRVASQAQDPLGQLTSFSLESLSGAFGGLIDCMVDDKGELEPLAAVLALSAAIQSDPERVVRCIRVALEHHQNGFLYYVLAGAHARIAPAAGSEREHLLQTREYWTKAAETFSTLPQTRRVAAVARARIERRIAQDHGDAQMRALAAQRPLEFLEVRDPGPRESREFAEIALWSDQPDAALEIVRRALARHPSDDELGLLQARAMGAVGRFEDALAVLQPVLALDPASLKGAKRRTLEERQARAQSIRTETLAAWDAWNARSAAARAALR